MLRARVKTFAEIYARGASGLKFDLPGTALLLLTAPATADLEAAFDASTDWIPLHPGSRYPSVFNSFRIRSRAAGASNGYVELLIETAHEGASVRTAPTLFRDLDGDIAEVTPATPLPVSLALRDTENGVTALPFALAGSAALAVGFPAGDALEVNQQVAGVAAGGGVGRTNWIDGDDAESRHILFAVMAETGSHAFGVEVEFGQANAVIGAPCTVVQSGARTGFRSVERMIAPQMRFVITNNGAGPHDYRFIARRVNG